MITPINVAHDFDTFEAFLDFSTEVTVMPRQEQLHDPLFNDDNTAHFLLTSQDEYVLAEEEDTEDTAQLDM